MLVRAREWERDRFWVLPSLLVLAGVVLAVLTAEAERLGIPTSWPSGLRVDPSAAGDILGVVAASMLTFVGVVFTLTLVALQLASAQLSPRVIRTFVRSGVTKAAFGIFLATFAYALVALVLEGAGDSAPAQSRAVTISRPALRSRKRVSTADCALDLSIRPRSTPLHIRSAASSTWRTACPTPSCCRMCWSSTCRRRPSDTRRSPWRSALIRQQMR